MVGVVDTHRQAIEHFIETKARGTSPPIDLSKLRQGVVDPVTWSGPVGKTWTSASDLQTDITEQLRERGKLPD